MMRETRIVLRDIDIPDIDRLESYVLHGGYETLDRRRGSGPPRAVVEEVRASGLCARHGSWRPVIDAGRERFQRVCVSAHECAPGVFRQRKLLERNPHQFLEGLALLAYGVGACEAYVSLSSTMRKAGQVLSRALEEARAAGWVAASGAGSDTAPEVHLVWSPAGYPGAEPSALLNGLEGERPDPSLRPLELFEEPALVVDGDTLAYLPHIVGRGAEWFRSVGTARYPGTCVCCVSGHVRRPGLYEVALGSGTLGELIEDCAGGVRAQHSLKAVLVGGIGGSILSPSQLDVPLAPEDWALPGQGVFPGSLNDGSVVVMDDTTCMVQTAAELMDYCARQSCGVCPGCRAGTRGLAVLFARLEAGRAEPGDVGRARDLCAGMAPFLHDDEVSLCGLGTAAAWLAHGFLSGFGDEFAAHEREGRCPVNRDDSIKVPETISVRF